MKEGVRRSLRYDGVVGVFIDTWRPYAWLFALAFATYAWTTGFGFSPLDDRWMIVDRMDELRHLSAVPAVFTRAVLEIYYRPLLALSFVIDATTGRGGPFAFHLTNVLLHGLVSATLFAFFTKLDLTRRSAVLLSALFAVHPVHVHAVAWSPGRNDVILALFALGATIAFLDYLASRSAAALALHVCFFALALLTKESAAVLPWFGFLIFFSRRSRRSRRSFWSRVGRSSWRSGPWLGGSWSTARRPSNMGTFGAWRSTRLPASFSTAAS